MFHRILNMIIITPIALFLGLILAMTLNGVAGRYDQKQLQNYADSAFTAHGPAFTKLISILEDYKTTHGSYPASLTDAGNQLSVDLAAGSPFTNITIRPMEYLPASDGSFYVLNYEMYGSGLSDVGLSAKYFSLTKNWAADSSYLDFDHISLKHFGYLHQQEKSAHALTHFVIALRKTGQITPRSPPCRNLWTKYLTDYLGPIPYKDITLPDADPRDKAAVYVDAQNKPIYAFTLGNRYNTPRARPIDVIRGIYRYDEAASSWKLEQACDSSEDRNQ